MPLALLFALACAPAEEASAPPAADDFEGRRRAIDSEVKTLIADLGAAGHYDCCILKPCKSCAMRTGGCRCGDAARRGEPVCEECAMMWAQGQGAEPGVDPASVRSYLEASRPGNHGEMCPATPEMSAPKVEAEGCRCGHEALSGGAPQNGAGASSSDPSGSPAPEVRPPPPAERGP